MNRGVALGLALTVTLVLGPPGALTAPARAESPPSEPERVSPAAPDALLQSYERLIDPEHSTVQRQQAVATLLDSHAAREHPEAAADLLAEALAADRGPEVWRPVLMKLALHPAPPPRALAEPLLALSERVDANLRPPLAGALGRLIDPPLARQLTERAQKHEQSDDAVNNLSMGARQVAVLALGHHRTQSTAAVLIALTEPQHPASIRQAAFTALQTLTGLTHLDADAEAWHHWWQEARELSERQWDHMLLDNLARRSEQQHLDQRDLSSRLQDLVRSQYRATDAEQRAPLLARLLNDPLDAVRELAMTLSVQRLVDDGQFDEPLRQALRARLDDPVPEIRQRATLLLRDLADAPAADHVATRLAAGREAVVPVLRAKLLMLTRLPRAAAIEAGTELLDHPALGAEAAGMLAAAAEAELIDAVQIGHILDRVRLGLTELPPQPQFVRLLGRIGRESEWQRIADWLDHERGSIRQAAAQVWAESDRSLEPLAERAGDVRVGPVFMRAAAQRGQGDATLEVLIAHPPAEGDADQIEQWSRALVAVAARASPDAVLVGVRQLASLNTKPALREAMLTAALDSFDNVGREDDGAGEAVDAGDAKLAEQEETGQTDDADIEPQAQANTDADALIDLQVRDAAEAVADVSGDTVVSAPAFDLVQQRAALQLARAAVRLEAMRTTRARADLEAAAALAEKLNAEQRVALKRKMIHAHLQAEDIEQAVELAERTLVRHALDPQSAAMIVSLLLDAAGDQVEADQYEQAQRILDRLNTLVEQAGEATGSETRDRLAQIEKRIEQADASASEPDAGTDEAVAAEGGESAESADEPDADDTGRGEPAETADEALDEADTSDALGP